MSKESNQAVVDQLKLLNGYTVSDLLYVMREFENNPRNFEPEIIKKVTDMLYEKGIKCI